MVCGNGSSGPGSRPAAPGGRHESTGKAIVVREDGDRDAVILIPGADAALDSRTALDDTAPDDVVLIQLDVPPAVVADVLREADRRQLRVVVNASPYATVDPEAAALADPFVVGERDAAMLADVGVMPRSLCVTFGRAGAVWDGLRMDSGDLGSPALAAGGRGVLRDAGRRPRGRVRPPRGAPGAWLPPRRRRASTRAVARFDGEMPFLVWGLGTSVDYSPGGAAGGMASERRRDTALVGPPVVGASERRRDADVRDSALGRPRRLHPTAGSTITATVCPATRVSTTVASDEPLSRSCRRTASGSSETPRFLIVSRPTPLERSQPRTALTFHGIASTTV